MSRPPAVVIVNAAGTFEGDDVDEVEGRAVEALRAWVRQQGEEG